MKRLSLLAAGTLLAVQPEATRSAESSAPDQAPAASALAPFLELAPMIGHVGSTNACIWVQSSAPARAALRIGERADLSDAREVRGPSLEAAQARMGSIQIPDLQPARRYFYCVLLDGRSAMLPPYPSFQTAPPPASKGRVRFAFTSCVGYHGYDAAAGYADMAVRTNFDLVLMLGDNHYANTTAPEVQRAFYADQRRQAGWRALSQGTPTYAIWDDHDYGPDNSDRTLPGKEKSLRTFKEHWANPAYGEADNPGIYCKFTRGDVEFFLLDVRYHRDPNRAAKTPEKTMLGEKQLAWLKRELAASKATVKVLVSGSEWQSHGTADSWTSFPREREEIFRFLDEKEIAGVLLISGDRHFTAAYQVQGKWIEVTSGPLGSSNANSRHLPEMFLHWNDTRSKFYCGYDIDTRAEPPQVTLEVYRVAEGLAARRTFTWDEVGGKSKIATLPLSTDGKTPRAPDR